MKTINLIQKLIIFSNLVAVPLLAGETDVKDACRASESWSLSTQIDKEWTREFESFISGKTSSTRGFSEAVALRKQSVSEMQASIQKQFSEYWISRTLFSSKFYHQAHQGFLMIVKNSTEKAIQKAAVQCLGEIQKRVPSLELPSSLPWDVLKGDPGNADAVFLSFITQVGVPKSDPRLLKSILDLLHSYHVAHANFAEGVYYSSLKNYPKSIEAFEKLFSNVLPEGLLKNYTDSGRILLARAYYSIKNYPLATKNFHTIKKNSNELTEVLSELSWSYLMSGHYEESVGVVMQLRARGFKNTFTPEATMVSAMAFNELCQYPASLTALQSFKAEYAPEYAWLKRWSESPKTSLYSQAVQFIRGKSEVPLKVGNEWIRSASFLSRQDELNLVLKQTALSQQISNAAKREHILMRNTLTLSIVKFIEKYHSEKRRMKPGGKISPSLLVEFQDIRTQFQHFNRFRQASRPWKKLTDQFQAKLPSIRARLVSSIETDLNIKNRKMLSLLQEIAENNELISAEIYTGASQDLVWKNAHPDYVQVVKNIGKGDANRRPASEVWNWGTMNANANDGPEVWEDEVGFAKADLTDNCADKEKYLKVKNKRIIQ